MAVWSLLFADDGNFFAENGRPAVAGSILAGDVDPGCATVLDEGARRT